MKKRHSVTKEERTCKHCGHKWCFHKLGKVISGLFCTKCKKKQ